MITYNRTAFGLNLVFRIHGSAVYRSFVPSLIAVGVFFLIRDVLKPNGVVDFGDNLGHPYAIGVLVASTTFLIVFRANQGYSRYWEAATATHHMMSKWMDATTHSCVYHLQCDHYKDIKPPSYFDYEALNHLNLTRHRERGWEYEDEEEDESDEHLRDEDGDGLGAMISNTTRRHHSQENLGVTTSKRVHRKQVKEERTIRSLAKSINKIGDARKLEKFPNHSTQRNQRSKSMDDIDELASKKVPKHNFSVYFDKKAMKNISRSKPFPLQGRPRLDGNWGAYFTKEEDLGGKQQPMATFFDPKNPDFIDPKGFAGMQGGNTPPLFLQELAHLSSLLVAVALSTLRNDIEGSESPLAVYEPGSPWPEVDPDKDEWLRVDSGTKVFMRSLATFLGMGRSPDEQTRYNAARPLPVIGGISDAEIRFLQMAKGPYAKTQLCWNWLSEFCIREHLAGSMGKVGPPIISRIIQFLGDGMIFYNHARKVMYIPFPFAHAQLSVLFILVMVPCIPFLMDQYTDDAWLGAILTFFTVLCLSGIHEVARELENPFRNVPNELPLVTFQAQYNEALITMYSGYHPDHFWDGDRVLKQRGRQPSAAAAAAASPGSESSSKPPTTPTNGSVCSNNTNADEIAALKKQLAEQAKLIEQLAAKINTTTSEEGIKRVEEFADNAMNGI